MAASWGGRAMAAPRVVLLEMAGGARDIRQEVRASAEQALRELGVEVVPQSQVKVSLDDCNIPACLADVGRQARASHILEIQGSYVNESYNLRLDLRDGETGRILGSDAKECEICSARDFYRAVKDRSAALWTRVVREQTGAGAAPTEAAPATPARVDLTKTKVAPPPAKAGRSFWRQPLPLVGLGLTAGAAVLLGFGSYYLAVDGDPDPSCGGRLCPFKRSTATLGWGLVGGGVAALAGGVALLIWGRDDPDAPAISLGPGTVTLSGSF
ncbi:MAG: hypothetical protein WCG85_09510 [Polyangia bacterium]